MTDCRKKVCLSVLILILAGLASCRAAIFGNGGRSGSVRIVLPFDASSSSPKSRLLLPAVQWVSLSASDGVAIQSNRKTYSGTAGSVSFDITLTVGVTYTLTAAAGTTVNGTDTVAFTGTTTLTPALTDTTATLYLCPVADGLTTLSASGTIAPTLDCGDYVTYKVDLASNSHFNMAGVPTGYSVYAQNLDGSPVTAATNGNGLLAIEQSSLASGATSFLLTIYNATGTSSPSLQIVCDTAAHILPIVMPSDGPACLTHIGTTLYWSAGTSSVAYCSLSSYPVTAGTLSLDTTSASVYTPFGITTDGTDLYVANNMNYSVVKLSLSGSAAVVSTVTTISGAVGGVACTGGNLYFVWNNSGSGNIYQIASTSTGTASSFATTHGGAAGICTDGTWLYVLCTEDGSIVKTEIATKSQTTLTESGALGGDFCATDGTWLYFTAKDSGYPVVKKMPVSGSDADIATVYTAGSSDSLGGLDIVDGNLYVGVTINGTPGIYWLY